MSQDKKPTKPSSYEVGYRKPPLHSRFAKGQSGNPKGRPRKAKRSGSSTLSDLSAQEAFFKLAMQEITTNDGSTITVRDGILKAEAAAALKGNTLAQKNFLNRYRRFEEERIRDVDESNDIFRAHVANYDRIVQLYLKQGKPVPDALPHPDDIEFVKNDYIRLKGGDPEIAAQNWRWMVMFRDALILQAEADQRSFPRTNPDETPPLFVSDFLAFFTNTCLPKRFQLDDLTFCMRIDKAPYRFPRGRLRQR
jgi:hypothetical protein